MSTMTDVISVVIKASSAGAVKELDALQREAKKSDTAFDTLGKRIGLTGSTIKAGLAAGAAALAGAGLVSFLGQSAEAFADAAKAADDLAAATGGTVEEVSAMQAALMDAGVSAETSAGLLTKFTTNAGKNQKAIKDLGVTMTQNADGSTDYASSMVDVLDAINKTGDASKRNQLLVKFFGKAGAQAFQDLANSGVSLSEAMQLVSRYRIFDASDVARAKAYDDAMDGMRGTVQGLQFQLGSVLLPVLSTTLGAFSAVVDVLMDVPAPVYIAVGAFVALSAAMRSVLVGQALSAAAALWQGLAVAFVQTGGAAGVAAAGIRGLGAAMLANPVGLIIAGIAAAVLAFNYAADRSAGTARRLADDLGLIGEEGLAAGESIESAARKVEEASSAVDDMFASAKGQGWLWLAPPVATFKTFIDTVRDGGQDLAVYEAELQKIVDEQGSYAGKAADSAKQQSDLNDLLASGTATQAELAAAAAEAAAAQAGQNAVAEAAKTWMLEYDTSIQGVIARMKELAGETGGIEEQKNKVQELGKAWLDASDDLGTVGDETVIAKSKFTDSIAGMIEVWQASGLSSLEIQTNLAALRDSLPPGLAAAFDEAIAGVAGATAPINVTTTGIPEAEAGIGPLKEPADKTITVTTEYAPDGYNAVKARADYLAQQRTGSININTTFSPDGYNALKARADYLARDRTAYIDIAVRGQAAAARAIASVAAGTASAAATGSVPGPAAAPQFSPINVVRVSVDGKQLRSVVRDEVRAMQPEPAGVV
jgi:hypothetical protein